MYYELQPSDDLVEAYDSSSDEYGNDNEMGENKVKFYFLYLPDSEQF